MRIEEITYLYTVVPDGSCGTGYSEPNIFMLEMDNGNDYKVYIDIWYIPCESIRRNFMRDLDIQLSDVFNDIENLDEAFKMYAEEIVLNQLCPYTLEEITAKNDKPTLYELQGVDRES